MSLKLQYIFPRSVKNFTLGTTQTVTYGTGNTVPGPFVVGMNVNNNTGSANTISIKDAAGVNTLFSVTLLANTNIQINNAFDLRAGNVGASQGIQISAATPSASVSVSLQVVSE